MLFRSQVAFGMVLRRAGYGPYKNIDIVADLFYLYFDLQMILITLLCRIDLFIKLRFDHPELVVCTPVYCILPGCILFFRWKNIRCWSNIHFEALHWRL